MMDAMEKALNSSRLRTEPSFSTLGMSISYRVQVPNEP